MNRCEAKQARHTSAPQLIREMCRATQPVIRFVCNSSSDRGDREPGTLANRLLRARPDLRILATIRESMGIAGENIVLEPSLSLPDGVLGAEVCEIESRIGRGVGIEPSSRPGVYL